MFFLNRNENIWFFLVFVVNPVGWPKGLPGRLIQKIGQLQEKRSTHSVNPKKGQLVRSTYKKVNPVFKIFFECNETNGLFKRLTKQMHFFLFYKEDYYTIKSAPIWPQRALMDPDGPAMAPDGPLPGILILTIFYSNICNFY